MGGTFHNVGTKPMKPINRRESPRLEIKLRCFVAAPSGRVRSAMQTENMSRNGLLIAWKSENGAVPPPTVGQIVTVEIELPANHGFGPKCLHCQGWVTRVAYDHSDGPRVALRLNYMDFRSLHGRPYTVALREPASGASPANPANPARQV